MLFHFVPLKVFKAFQNNCFALKKSFAGEFCMVEKKLVLSVLGSLILLGIALIMLSNVVFAQLTVKASVADSIFEPVLAQNSAEKTVFNFEEQKFELRKGEKREIFIGGQKLSVGLLELGQKNAKISFESEKFSKSLFFLGVGERVRIGGLSVKLGGILQNSAVFKAETDFEEGTKDSIEKNAQSPAIAPASGESGSDGAGDFFNITSESQMVDSKPVNIGGGQLTVAVYPTKTFQVIGESVSEKYELPKEFGYASSNASQKIMSVSIRPDSSKVRAEIKTSSGNVLQEISKEFFPVVNYKNVFVSSDSGSQKVVLSEGKSVAKTGNEIEINGGLFIKSSDSKEKIEIFPEQALGLIREKMKAEPKSVELKIEGKQAIYSASQIKKGKFLGLFPVEFEAKVKVDAKSEETKSEQPFWSALVFQ